MGKNKCFDGCWKSPNCYKRSDPENFRTRCGCALTAQWAAKKNGEKKLGWKVPTGFDQQCKTNGEINHNFERSHFSTNQKQHIQCNAWGNMVGWEVWDQTSASAAAGGVFWQQALIKTAATHLKLTPTHIFCLPQYLHLPAWGSKRLKNFDLNLLIPLLSG